MSDAVLEQKSLARLICQREQAIGLLQMQIKKGAEIKSWRIRCPDDLNKARAAKLAWTTRSIELLNAMFDNSSVAEACNDWVGKVYPEYAEFGKFVEQFYAEMDHRLRRLKAVLKHIQSEKISSIARPVAVVQTQAPSASTAATQPQGRISAMLLSSKADEPTQQAVCQFLQSLDIDVSVVDQLNAMTQLLEAAERIDFALVLANQPSNGHDFELGYCAGRLGIRRVFLLSAQGSPEADSAKRHGLTHISIDPGGGWQLQFAKHLKRAGIQIDLNRLCEN